MTTSEEITRGNDDNACLVSEVNDVIGIIVLSLKKLLRSRKHATWIKKMKTTFKQPFGVTFRMPTSQTVKTKVHENRYLCRRILNQRKILQI